MPTIVKKKKVIRLRWIIVAVLLLSAAIVLALRQLNQKPLEPVLVNDGVNDIYITPDRHISASKMQSSDFSMQDGRMEYIGSHGTARHGIDVSEYQLDIDWAQVAQSGIDFAIIRAGYRSSIDGSIHTDAYFSQNIENAIANGIDVGVYFFSQALTVDEAREEAQYVLDAIKGYKVKLPIVFDWEFVENANARSNSSDSKTLTACALAFCQEIESNGYDAAVYFNRQFGYYYFDLPQLADFDFWLADPCSYPNFYYDCRLWQYNFQGNVPGISTNVDLDLQFVS